MIPISLRAAEYPRLLELLERQPNFIHVKFDKPTVDQARNAGAGIFSDGERDPNPFGMRHFNAAGYALMAKTIADAERSFAEIGFLRETRPFSPHATIARKRSERDRDAAKNVLSQHRNEEFGEIRVHAPVLFRSTLTPQGPVYESLGEAVA